MSLLIPWARHRADHRAHPRRRAASPSSADPQRLDALRRGVAGAQVLLRAEVGSAQMPIEQMLELAPGSLLALEDRAEDGVLLFAEGISLGRGRPGRSGAQARRQARPPPAKRPCAPTRTRSSAAPSSNAPARTCTTSARRPEDPAILRSIFVRVWAELGRTHLPLGAALELAPGAVVELDQRAEAPVELFANGLCFANGTLVVTADGAWGVQVASSSEASRRARSPQDLGAAGPITGRLFLGVVPR